MRVFFFLLCFFSLVQPGHTQTGRKLLQVSLQGNAFERGLLHGQTFKNNIHVLLGKWKDNIRQSLHKDPDSLLTAFLGSTDFLPAIQRYCPDLLEEVKGIAEGSGQSFQDVYAFQLPDEFWVYVDGMGKDSLHHCSGLGIPARNGKPAYISQNLDIDAWMDGQQLLLHIEGSKKVPEQYILTCPGLIGMTGMNALGTGVCVNTLLSLRAQKTGLPVAFMVRSLLRLPKNKVLRFIRETPHASGQNYLLGIGDSLYDFEASANRVERLLPDSAGLLAHTNHPLVNTDIKPWYASYYKAFVAGKTQHYNSEKRLAAILQRTKTGQAQEGTELIRSILRSKDDPRNPVCNAVTGGRPFFTFGSVLMTLSGKRSLQVTAGPPDESDFQVYYFSSTKKF